MTTPTREYCLRRAEELLAIVAPSHTADACLSARAAVYAEMAKSAPPETPAVTAGLPAEFRQVLLDALPVLPVPAIPTDILRQLRIGIENMVQPGDQYETMRKRADDLFLILDRLPTQEAARRWTTQTPTEPGYYWFRRKGVKAFIGRVARNNDGDFPALFFKTDIGLHYSLDAYPDAEWQGPIEPED